MNPVDLNQTNQADLYTRLCSRMSEMVPGWSDDIPSDPAVAILELVSYLSDMQNQRINAVSAEHYRAYLKLLDGKQRSAAPAELLARDIGDKRTYPGQRFWIDGVPFEVVICGGPDSAIASITYLSGKTQRTWDDNLPLTIEGQEPTLLITFTNPIPQKAEIQLWCSLIPDSCRVPPDDQTPPPVTICAQVSDGTGWREVPLEDGTCGLLRSGYLITTPEDGAVASLRLTIKGRIEGRPQISQVALSPIRLEQRHTRCATVDLTAPFRIPEGWTGNRVIRYFLPETEACWREAPGLYVYEGEVRGWGETPPPVIRVVAAEPDFPFEHTLQSIAAEEVVLEEPGVLTDSVQLMVQENGLWYDCPIGEPEPGRTLPRGCHWLQDKQILCFGDGRDFCVPVGGHLLVTSCITTLGSMGNGACGLMTQGGVQLLALGPATGGCDLEAAKDAFFRVAKEQAEPLRAVTTSDYEVLARKTPGLALNQVRAITHRAQGRKEAGITLIVKPDAHEDLPMLTPWQTERLQNWMEQYRLIGVPVDIHSPRYLPFEVTASLQVSEPIAEQVIRETVLALADGVSGPLDFGAEVSYTALYAALGALDSVVAVTSLELRPLSSGVRRSQDGSVRLKPDMLPYLKSLRVTQS